MMEIGSPVKAAYAEKYSMFKSPPKYRCSLLLPSCCIDTNINHNTSWLQPLATLDLTWPLQGNPPSAAMNVTHHWNRIRLLRTYSAFPTAATTSQYSSQITERRDSMQHCQQQFHPMVKQDAGVSTDFCCSWIISAHDDVCILQVRHHVFGARMTHRHGGIHRLQDL